MTTTGPHSNVRQVPTGVWVLGLVSLFMDLSSETIHALLPLYLVTFIGASALTVGIIEGVAEATASITKIFSGVLSDWLGKRKILAALGYGLSALTKPIFPLADTIGWFVAARFVDRVGKGVRDAPRDALIADIAPPTARGASYGLRQALDTAGALLGPLLAIGGMWFFADNFKIVFWIAVIPAFLSFGLISFAIKEPERPARARRTQSPLTVGEMRRMGGAYWWVVAIAVVFTLARFSEAFLILRAQSINLPIVLVPAVMVIMNVAYSLSAYPVGILSDKVDRTTLLGAGIALLVLADLALGLSGSLIGVGIGVALWGLHMGFTQGLFATLVADAAPPERRGTAFGMFNLMTGLAQLAASIVAGGMWELAGPQGTFLAGAGFAALTLSGLLACRGRLRHQPLPNAINSREAQN